MACPHTMKVDATGDGRVTCADCGKDVSQPRMNGTLYERCLFRIAALREGLRDVTTCADADAMRALAKNALHCDDERN